MTKRHEHNSLDGFQIVDLDGNPSTDDFSFNEPLAAEPHDYPEFTSSDAQIKLVAETVKNALDDLLDKDPDIRKEAREWFKSKEINPPSKTEPVNFLWICETFDIDADWLRKKLLDFAEERVRNKAAQQHRNPGPVIGILRMALLNGKKKSSKPETIHANR